ncbi:MAG: DUF4861 domain-containing protein [Bacteroides sp.]|nr:DUF4861 domain-containing protein [Bacteroides sp.]
MKKILLLFLLTTCMACHQGEKMTSVTLYNPTDRERVDESFVMKASELTPPAPGMVPLLKTPEGVYLPSQPDDTDQDGAWDELAFICTLPPSETVKLSVEWVHPEDYPEFPVRTNVRFGKMTSPSVIEELTTDIHYKENLPRGEGYPYQMDGPAWENDKVGFRHYFDGRNCRDVFGKLIPSMVLDTVGIRADGTPGDTYHVMSRWGRDIMSAAHSFGLGGVALQLPDTLVRLGVLQEQTVDNVDSTRYTLLTQGPVRSMLKLDFHGWEVTPGEKVDVSCLITIWAGKYGYENRVTTSPLPEGSRLITGIVANNNDKEFITHTYRDTYTSMNTHDKQTYDKTWYMGMSLILPAESVVELFHAPDTGSNIKKTWCVAMRPDETGTYRYNAYAAWEMSDRRFSDRDYYLSLVCLHCQK